MKFTISITKNVTCFALILVQRKSFNDCFCIFRHQRTFKIVVLGDAGTGKSSLITRFVDGTFASRRLELVAVRCDSNVAT